MATNPNIANGPLWGIVILNWNKSALTLECLRSVFASLSASNHCIRLLVAIVDNGSSAACVERLREGTKYQDHCILIENPRNSGFAAGMNLGLRELRRIDAEKVLFLNNDCMLHAEFFRSATSYAVAYPNKQVVGFRIVNPHTNSTATYGGYRYYSWFGMARPNLKLPTIGKAQKIDYVAGAAMLIDMTLLKELGGLPDCNFLYFEELNLANKMENKQLHGVAHEAIVYHAGSASTSELQCSPTPHYYAALACYRYTAATGPYKLPSVVLTRQIWLTWRALKTRDPLPMLDGLLALKDLICNWSSVDGRSGAA